MTTPQPSTAAVKYTHWLALTGYFALVIGIYLWHIVIHKTPHEQLSLLLVIQLGPLMFPLRGLLERQNLHPCLVDLPGDFLFYRRGLVCGF